MKWLKSSGKKCRDLNEKLIHHLIIPTSNQNLENGCVCKVMSQYKTDFQFMGKWYE